MATSRPERKAAADSRCSAVGSQGRAGTRQIVCRIIADKSGQDLIEYALVVALIAFAAAAGMTTVATKINAAFTNIGTKLTTYTS